MPDDPAPDKPAVALGPLVYGLPLCDPCSRGELCASDACTCDALICLLIRLHRVFLLPPSSLDPRFLRYPPE